MDAINRKYQTQLKERLMGSTIQQQLEKEKAKKSRSKRDYRKLMTGFYIGFAMASLIFYFTS
jgi:hypothetical protein